MLCRGHCLRTVRRICRSSMQMTDGGSNITTDVPNQQKERSMSAQSASSSGTQDGFPGCYLIVHNVSKRHNIGTLVRSAAAFGVTEVCLVGTRHFNTFGSHGSADFVKYSFFPTLQECCRVLKEDRRCSVVGVEIADDAQPIHSHPFSGATAFMLGNEGSGLSVQQASLCDAFVYIPQYGAGTASLNVTVAASIVLQHFAVWARFPERPRQGAKFEVGSRPDRTGPRGMVPLSEAEMALEQQRRRERREAAAGNGSLHDMDGHLGLSEECGSRERSGSE